MSIFQKLFPAKKQPQQNSAWEETVASMHDQDLDSFDGVQNSVYSKDGARRFVILLSPDGRYRYEYQELIPYSQEEREFFAQMGRTSGAYWSIDCTKSESPGWPAPEDVLREMQQEKEYKKYF